MYSRVMLTKNDINQLLVAFKKVFLTKDDAKGFLTKDDAKHIFQTKIDTQGQHDAVILKLTSIEKRVSSIEEDVQDIHDAVVPALGNLHQWTDEIHRDIVREKLPARVKRIEKHLSLPPLAD